MTAERETLDVDVLIVGGGPAGLSAALRLAQLQKAAGRSLSVAVLEKAREAGAHLLSGAVLDPRALAELVPDFEARGVPPMTPVRDDHVYFLTGTGRLRFPVTPPPLRNHGNFVISLQQFGKWLAQLVETEGIDLFSGFAGAALLMDGDRVVGVRTGDRGVDRHGQKTSEYQPGVDIHARVTILADGVRGNLTKDLLSYLPPKKNRQPQVYALGVKELWEIPQGRLPAGTVIHTLGFPLDRREFGGGFVYALSETRASVGFVAGLDYRDPMFDPHQAFQRFKSHPFMAALLNGGQMIRYGAKSLPEGGWNAIPTCYTNGALIVGDAAGFLDVLRLKGIHLAMKSGMLAAETAFEAIVDDDASVERLAELERKIRASWIAEELYPVRNVRQAFEHGLLAGLAFSGLSLLTRGWWVQDPIPGVAGHTRMERLDRRPHGPSGAPEAVKPDRRLTFDKLTDVHFSGTRHEENQPSHLLVHTEVCHTICGEEFGHPCTRFCPANVYEIVTDGHGGERLQINASNCVHCKACDIADPYQVITWVPPEGGGGPQYEGM